MDKNEFKIIFEAINEKPIAYHRIYTKITGRVVGGILLSQLVYWAITKNWGEFYKTDKDVADELGVSIKEVRGAKSILKKFDFIKITIKSTPAKTYYKIDPEKLMESIADWANKFRQIGQTRMDKLGKLSITENTTYTLSEAEASQKGELSTGNTPNTDNWEYVKLDPDGEEIVRKPPKAKYPNSESIFLIFKEVLGIYPANWRVNRTQRQSAENLYCERGPESIKKALMFYNAFKDDHLCPMITSPFDLDSKWEKLKAYKDRDYDQSS